MSTMNNILKTQYGRYSVVTQTWDLVQKKLRCCGVDDRSWGLYRDSWWDNFINADLYDKDAKLDQSSVFYSYVPESCCWKLIDPLTGWPKDVYVNKEQCQNWQFGPPNLDNGAHNSALYYRGCFHAIKSYLQMYAMPIGIIALLLIIVMIVALVCAVRLLYIIRTKRKIL